MASNISSETIDAAYPIAGIDNDTQGFRDNFSVIKNNFASAKSEIEQLQNNTVKLDQANNFNGTYIIDANLQAVTLRTFDPKVSVGSDQNISFLNGHYQKITVGEQADTLTFTLADWPLPEDLASGPYRYAKITVEIVAASGSQSSKLIPVDFIIEGGGNLKTNTEWPTALNIDTVADSTRSTLLEFWSYDGGDNVYANYLGKFS